MAKLIGKSFKPAKDNKEQKPAKPAKDNKEQKPAKPAESK